MDAAQRKRGKSEAGWGDKFLFLARRWPLYIDAYDKDYTCIFWNQEAERISGYSAKEIEGNPNAYTLLYPDPEKRERLLRSIKLRGYDFSMAEWRLTTKGGEERNIYCVNISKLFQPFPEWDHWSMGMDLTPLFQAEHDLSRRNQELTEYSRRLSEMNIALKVLLEKQEASKRELREDFIKGQNDLVLPFLEKLRATPLDAAQEALLETAIDNIHANMSEGRNPLENIRSRLTTTEFEVATFISRGKSTLEISGIMNLAPYTVATHRNNIRRKLALVKKRVNLAVHLRSAFEAKG